MKIPLSLAAICVLPLFSSSVKAESTGSPFYGDAPDANHPWAVHDHNRPQPIVVTPGTFSSQEQPGKPPSDAVILFDGTEESLLKWVSDKQPSEPTKWVIKEGSLQCVPGSGYVRTKDEFGDCQLHVEWTEPTDITGESQGRGNSGIFLMGATEVQVLDSYNNPTYADGSAGSVYGVNPPMANPLRAPGQWQNYDIVFRRPIYKDGKEIEAGTVTVFINGVLVQDHTPLEGGGGHKSRSKLHPFPEKGPLKLQDHGNPVKYRNIWYRPLPIRSVEGGTNGYLTEEATMAKRKEIAEGIRSDAAKLEGNAKLLRLMESLYYEKDEAVLKQSEQMLGQYVETLKQVPADKIESRKGEVLQFNSALEYLAKFKIIPDSFAAKVEIAKMIKDHELDKKK